MTQPDRPALDGVALPILSNRLRGITRRMSSTLLRTARSGVINAARDFSCCLLTASCDLVAAADSLPIHVLSGPDAMARAMLDFHPGLQPGDAFLHNSPYHGCSHAADLSLLVPVFDAAERHRFTVVVKAHQADIGNSLPTTYHAGAADVYEEGALLFPAVKVQSGYRDVDDVVRMCRLRIRAPDQWWGDYLAMVGAARVGEAEVRALAGEIGWETLDRFAADWFDYSERCMAEAISRMPGGRARRVSVHDAVPGLPPGGAPISASVAIDAASARIVVDLTENMDCQPCGLNLSEATARTACLVGVFNSIDPGVPKNAGSFRRVDVRLRENCIAGIARHPSSTSVATTNVADRCANAVQTAIAEIADGFGLAECGAVIPPAAGVLSGTDPTSGHAFVNQVFLGMSGGAGAPSCDRWLTIGHVGNGGQVRLDSVEHSELTHPIRVYSRRYLQDSEGAGRHIGAACVEVVFGPLGGPVTVAFVSDGTLNPPLGVRGGQAGAGAGQWLIEADGIRRDLPNCASLEILPGQRVVSVGCGGGGYGLPWERDPEAVSADAAEGWISIPRARNVYGVELRADGTVDQDATAACRRAMRSAA